MVKQREKPATPALAEYKSEGGVFGEHQFGGTQTT